MQFEFYVLNYDFNAKKVVNFNIFQNYYVQEQTEKAVRKYLRSPKKFAYKSYAHEPVYGFEGLCSEINSIIMCEEWARCEYEIYAGGFITSDNSFQKIDCYMQAKPNIKIITHEVIRQYKEQKKNE